MTEHLWLHFTRMSSYADHEVPVMVRGEELAVALSTTPNSTSANAWPARPFQALPRQIPGSI